MEEKDAGVEVAGLQVTSYPCYQFSLPLARKNGAMEDIGGERRCRQSRLTECAAACIDHVLGVTVSLWSYQYAPTLQSQKTLIFDERVSDARS